MVGSGRNVFRSSFISMKPVIVTFMKIAESLDVLPGGLLKEAWNLNLSDPALDKTEVYCESSFGRYVCWSLFISAMASEARAGFG